MRLVTSEGTTGRFFLPCRVVSCRGESVPQSLSPSRPRHTRPVSSFFDNSAQSFLRSSSVSGRPRRPHDPCYPLPSTNSSAFKSFIHFKEKHSCKCTAAASWPAVHGHGHPGDSHVRTHKGTNVLRVAFERPRETRAIGYSDMYYVTSSDKLTTVNARVRS